MDWKCVGLSAAGEFQSYGCDLQLERDGTNKLVIQCFSKIHGYYSITLQWHYCIRDCLTNLYFLHITGASTIRAYGMILNSVSTLGTYAIDGVTANMSVPTTFPAYNYELFTANPTTGESHTLEITAADANTFYLDYVLMKSDSAFISSPSLTGNGGNGGGNNHEKTDNSRHLGVGAIVGISIGGLVFLSFLLASFFVLRRRRRSETENTSDGHPPVDIDAEVTYAAFTQSPAGMDRMLTEAYHLRRSESGSYISYNISA